MTCSTKWAWDAWHPGPQAHVKTRLPTVNCCYWCFQVFQLLCLYVKRQDFMDSLFLSLLTGKHLSRYCSWLYGNILLRKNVLFYFSVTKCSLTVRKRKSQLAICHHLDGNSVYYFGPQESIWEPPSRSEHYKEKWVVCGCSWTWSSMRNLDFYFRSKAGGRTLVNTNSCSPIVECSPQKSLISGIL